MRTYSELQAILAQAVDIIGQRALRTSHHSGAQTGFTILTQNSLIKELEDKTL